MIDWDSCVLWLDNQYFSESWWWDRSKYNNDEIVYGAKFKEDAFYFDEVDDYINCGKNLIFENELSIEICFILNKNIDENLNTFKTLISKDKSGFNSGDAWLIFSASDNPPYLGKGKLTWVIDEGGNYVSIASDSNRWEANKLYCVVVTSKNMKMYVNGVPQNDTDTSSVCGFSNSETDLIIGNYRIDTSLFFGGKIKIVRLYKKILSDDEIKLLARNAGV